MRLSVSAGRKPAKLFMYTSFGVQQTSPRGPEHAETSREEKLHTIITQNDFGFRQNEWDQSEEKQRCGLETALDLLRGRRAANAHGRVVERTAPSVSVQALLHCQRFQHTCLQHLMLM